MAGDGHFEIRNIAIFGEISSDFDDFLHAKKLKTLTKIL